jgi:hypothetical protein
MDFACFLSSFVNSVNRNSQSPILQNYSLFKTPRTATELYHPTLHHWKLSSRAIDAIRPTATTIKCRPTANHVFLIGAGGIAG